MASDFGTYIAPGASKRRLFLYCYLGLALPSLPLMILGAAIGGAVPNTPALLEGYNNGSVGGALGAMLQPAGGFGKVSSRSRLHQHPPVFISPCCTVYTRHYQLLDPW